MTTKLGHSDVATTKRHHVQRVRVAPDLRVVIDQLVTQAAEDLLAEDVREGKCSENADLGTTKGPRSAGLCGWDPSDGGSGGVRSPPLHRPAPVGRTWP